MKMFILFVLEALLTLSLTQLATAQQDNSHAADPLPASDPKNLGGWILNEELSDEFEGNELDPNKWFIEGQDGDYYIWKGRAPSQFVPHNVLVEDGKLKLRTQWEPDYEFAEESYADGSNADAYGKFEGKPFPVTTAGVITKKRFLNGYMEVKSKVGNTAITGAFWAIGYEQELDVFEQMGKPKIKGTILENSVRSAVHDWSPPAVRPTKAFGYDEKNLPYRTADEFHIYGAEWGEDYLKVYRDGLLTYHVTQAELGTDWVLNNPMEIWLDSEIFKWLGVPSEDELPVNFEIEYMRVWQKPTSNLLPKQFFGFEGPVLFEDQPRPLTMVPESSVPNHYQKFWLLDSISAKYLRIVEGDYASGVNSLLFTGLKKNEDLLQDTIMITSPGGASDIAAGDYLLSMKLWLDQGRPLSRFHVRLSDLEDPIPIKVEHLERRQWVTIKQPIRKKKDSAPNDQFSIILQKEYFPSVKAARFLIDDIAIEKIQY